MKSFLSIDPLIFFPALILSILGIIGIYSTSFNTEYAVYKGMYLKQILWLVLGLILFISVLFVPLRVHEVFAYVYYGISIALLIAVLWFGTAGEAKAMRWFDLGILNLQPSEIAKMSLVFAMARFLCYYKGKFPNGGSVALLLTLGLVPFGLVAKQPDLGTALVFGAVTLFMLYWAGLGLFQLFLFVSPFVSMIAAFHPVAWGIYIVLLLTLLIRSRGPENQLRGFPH